MTNFNSKNLIKTMRNQNTESDISFKKELLTKIKREKLRKNLQANFFAGLKTHKQYAIALSFILVFAIGGIAYSVMWSSKVTENGLVNDWEYSTETATENQNGSFINLGFLNTSNRNSIQSPTADSSAELGYSVGGAKDINNFRENIKNGYLPLPTDITHEGLFYDYYFDTGKSKECRKLFCASYTTALTNDKFSGNYKEYLTVGLNSGLKEENFKRPPMNLMIVLDISGSMSSPFNSYHYDRYGNKKETGETSTKSKLEIAKSSIIEITKKLNAEDSFGMVLFDENAYVAKPMRRVGETDMNKIREGISKLTPQGATNMEIGLKKGKRLLEDYINEKNLQKDYENRVIFLTDAMPNTGSTSGENLATITRQMAEEKVYSTFVGVGVDFNSTLIEEITDVKGANYFSVNTENEFKQKIQEDFDLIVTPLVFDLKLSFDSNKFEVEDIYGVPGMKEYNASSGIINIKTLFPSRNREGEVKGGVILLKLKNTIGIKPSDKTSQAFTLEVSYQDRAGNIDKSTEAVDLERFNFALPNALFPVGVKPYGYENSGIRKSILLSNYANLMQNWLGEANSKSFETVKKFCGEDQFWPADYYIWRPCYIDSIKWERSSKKLIVSEEYKTRFEEFKTYFENEMKALGDDSLKKEVEILDILIKA